MDPEKLKELRAKRAALVAEFRTLHELSEKETRDLTTDEQTRMSTIKTDSDSLDAEIKAGEEYIANGRWLADQKTAGNVRQTIPAATTPAESATEPASPWEMAPRSGQLRAFKGPHARRDAYNAGQWCRAILFGDPNARAYCERNGVELRVQTEAVNTAGGFLVPTPLAQTIIDNRESYGVFRQECKVVPMGSESLVFPVRDTGLTAYFISETDDITASDVGWKHVELVAKKVGIISRMSTDLAEDAVISLADWLADEIAYAFAKKEDDCGLLGDGTTLYGGMYGATVKIDDGNHTASITTAASGNTAFATLDLADFDAMIGQLPKYAHGNAKWFISQVGFANSMQRLMDAAGGNTIADLTTGVRYQFLGYPVVISQVLNTTTTAQTDTIILLFGDLTRAALMGDRRGITLKSDSSRYLEYDQIAIQGTTRFQIVVHGLGDTSTAGPLLAMKTPAS